MAGVLQVCVGRAQPLQVKDRTVASAMGKRPVEGTVAVRPLGLDGDEQADLSVHGGLSKAVYAYPAEHLPLWQTLRAQARVADWGAPLPPGSFGENLLVTGLHEDRLWVGDRLIVHNARRGACCVLAVSEPRFPCFKFNAAMGFEQAAKMMVQAGCCGAYLAVVEPGTVAAGDEIELLPGPREVSIRELFRSRARG